MYRYTFVFKGIIIIVQFIYKDKFVIACDVLTHFNILNNKKYLKD